MFYHVISDIWNNFQICPRVSYEPKMYLHIDQALSSTQGQAFCQIWLNVHEKNTHTSIYMCVCVSQMKVIIYFMIFFTHHM